MLRSAKMKQIVFAWLSLPFIALAAEPDGARFDAHAAERFARLALACVTKEYPN